MAWVASSIVWSTSQTMAGRIEAVSLDLGIVNMPSAVRHAKRTRQRCTFEDQAAELRSKVHAICGKAASGSLRRTDFAK